VQILTLACVFVQVEALAQINTSQALCVWSVILRQIHNILCILHQVKRGRVVNVVKCHALLGKACENALEASVCKRLVTLAKLDKQVAVKWKDVYDKLKEK